MISCHTSLKICKTTQVTTTTRTISCNRYSILTHTHYILYRMYLAFNIKSLVCHSLKIVQQSMNCYVTLIRVANKVFKSNLSLIYLIYLMQHLIQFSLSLLRITQLTKDSISINILFLYITPHLRKFNLQEKKGESPNMSYSKVCLKRTATICHGRFIIFIRDCGLFYRLNNIITVHWFLFHRVCLY